MPARGRPGPTRPGDRRGDRRKAFDRLRAGELIVDFGQNLAGWAGSASTKPPAPCPVRHGEVLAADGSLYVHNLRTARQTDLYTTAGGSEVLEPRFTFHGFRYAEISRAVGRPGPG